MKLLKTYNPLKLLKHFNPLLFVIFTITAGLLVAVGTFGWLVYELFNPFNSSIYKVNQFDQKVWFEQERIYHPEPGVYSSLDCTRGRMYEDLDKNHLKRYMTKEEIEAILGHSTVQREYPESWFFKHLFKCFQYELGFCRNGPPTVLRFCSLRGFNLYSHKLVSQGDGGSEIFEDEAEHHQKYLEMVKRNNEAYEARRKKEQLQIKENKNDK